MVLEEIVENFVLKEGIMLRYVSCACKVLSLIYYLMWKFSLVICSWRSLYLFAAVIVCRMVIKR